VFLLDFGGAKIRVKKKGCYCGGRKIYRDRPPLYPSKKKSLHFYLLYSFLEIISILCDNEIWVYWDFESK
jgi:hypothetical protein